MQGCKFFVHISISIFFYLFLSLNKSAHTFTLNEYKIILEEAIKNVRFEKYLISSPWTLFKNKKLQRKLIPVTPFQKGHKLTEIKYREELQVK